jgi:hypothetical protein
MRNSWKVLLISGLLAGLWCQGASASAIYTFDGQDLAPIVDTIEDLPPADVTGWLVNFDPSNQWTSASNIATLRLWLDIVTEIAGDPTLVSEFSGFGQNSDETAAVYRWIVADTSAAAPAPTPEPATLGLLGGALLFFVFAAWRLQICLATKASSIPQSSTTS